MPAPVLLLKWVSRWRDASAETTQVIHETDHKIPVQYAAPDFFGVGVGYISYDALVLVQQIECLEPQFALLLLEQLPGQSVYDWL